MVTIKTKKSFVIKNVLYYTLKKCWVVLTQFWVKYGQTQPLGYIFLNYIFNPMFEFVHICPKIGLKQPSIF